MAIIVYQPLLSTLQLVKSVFKGVVSTAGTPGEAVFHRSYTCNYIIAITATEHHTLVDSCRVAESYL